MNSSNAGYPMALSIDLRVFNNQKEDYGVGDWIETLGFVPDYVFNHETYVGQIHSHNGCIDDTPLLLTWTAQRAIPGAQLWTRSQYKGLVEQLHARDVKFFQGAEAAWSVWPEFGEGSKDTWIYENLSELFVTYRNGATTHNEMGMINPLKRLKDGSYYEDMLLNDLVRFLDDYQMDGFFAADGFGGLCAKLEDGDYSDDMVDQFAERTGLAVKGATLSERANYIWENLRYQWVCFYSDRWADFYRKLVPALKQRGKDMIVMAPFKHGPADALMQYGFDYAKNAEAGLDFYALESMETNSRRWQNLQSMESVGIANTVTIKAIAPDARIFWMSATCNSPEHWHTLRDQPSMLERECIAMNTARCVGPEGKLIKGFDGVQPLFGIDLNAQEWRWYKKRLDIGHMDVVHNEGLVMLWSNGVLHEHARRSLVYPLTPVSVRLRFSGLPIHSAANFDNAKWIKNKSILLIQPLGISDGEIDVLEDLVCNKGKQLIVAGEVENARLQKLLGITATKGKATHWSLQTHTDWYDDIPGYDGDASGMGGYTVTDASSIVDLTDNGKLVGSALCHVKRSKGSCVFLRHVPQKFPSLQHKHTAYDRVCHPNVYKTERTGLLTIQQILAGMSEIHADSYALICARFIQHSDGSFPYSDRGQVLACTGIDGKHYIFCENPLNMQYTYMSVTLPKDKKYITELSIRKNGPMGYQYFGDLRTRRIDVCVPPEGLIPFEAEYQETQA